SGSRPTSSAYERTKARLKRPPGSFEMSFRSSASSADAEIFVLAAICLSEIPRRSRAWRSFPPKSSMAPVTLDNLRKRRQTHEHPAGRETGGPGGLDVFPARPIHAANRDDRQRRAPAHVLQRVEAGDRMSLGLSRRGKDRAEHQVVASAVGDRRVH